MTRDYIPYLSKRKCAVCDGAGLIKLTGFPPRKCYRCGGVGRALLTEKRL